MFRISVWENTYTKLSKIYSCLELGNIPAIGKIRINIYYKWNIYVYMYICITYMLCMYVTYMCNVYMYENIFLLQKAME